MIETRPDITTTLFTLPPDAKFLAVSELAPRVRAKIGPVDEGHAVLTRPGFRVTTRLLPAPLANLLAEFRTPSLLTDAVLRFARTHGQDPFATLDLAFDALATLVEARILVPEGSPDALAATPSLAAGQEFAGFEIEAMVRSLEDSEVYRAHTADGATVALKVARDERPAVAAMLANDARMLARLDGIDTPALLEHGTADGRAYVAMEWCEGVPIAIAAQQARAARDRRRLHELVSGMFDAYARLHGKGVLHGDVHPGNCLVRDDGRVAIVDFGNARAIDAKLEVDPTRAGIPQFYDPQMAEALLAGALPPGATPASEQYAVCVFAYLLLTGVPPIEAPGVQDELLRRTVLRPPLPFAARGIGSWPGVESVIGRGLSKPTDHRFPDMDSLAAAFRSAKVPNPPVPVIPQAAQRAFDGAVEGVLNLGLSNAPLEEAWFALRAAMALDDAELLAAADVIANRAGSDWRARAVAVLVARARSDARMENASMAAFRSCSESLQDSRSAAWVLRAAAHLLDGSLSRSPEATALGQWARSTLDRLMAESRADPLLPIVGDPLLTYAALLLARGGTVAVHPDVPAHLAALAEAGHRDVWLWALAHDLYADDRFKQLALSAALEGGPLICGLSHLRRHQLTGDPRPVAALCRSLVKLPSARCPPLQTALLVAEVTAPERAILPPYALASSATECASKNKRGRRTPATSIC